MASLSRKFLAALGIETDKVDQIISVYNEVIEDWKSKVAEGNDASEQLAKVTAELEQVKSDLKTAQDTIKAAEKDDYKGKYEAKNAEFEKLQADITAKESAAKREAALTEAAKAAKYSEDAIALILDSKKDYASRIEFDKDGKASNMDDIMQAIAADRPGLVPKATETHFTPANPPANDGVKPKAMTWEDIDKIKDTAERQNAMLANMESLGIN